MATFAYYNPNTNTIERRYPAQTNNSYRYMPYLLNFQPQDLTYVAKMTTELRADPPYPKAPQPFEAKTQKVNRQLDFNPDDIETIKMHRRPFDQQTNVQPEPRREDEFFRKPTDMKRESNPFQKGSESTPHEFLAIEDITEADLQPSPAYHQAPGHGASRYPQQHQGGNYDEGYRNQPAHQSYDNGRDFRHQPYPQRTRGHQTDSQNYSNGEDYGNLRNHQPRRVEEYNIIRPENLMINYKPEAFDEKKATHVPSFGGQDQTGNRRFTFQDNEDVNSDLASRIPGFSVRDPNGPEQKILHYNPEELSMNERILNVKFSGLAQERTKKFIMKRIENDIAVLEKFSTGIERGLKETDGQTKDLEAKSKAMWEEVERKRLELKANEVMRQIEQAKESDPEVFDEERLDNFFKENDALYAEIDKVLQENNARRSPEDYGLRNIPEEADVSHVSRSSMFGRANSSNIRNLSNIPYGSRSEYEDEYYGQPSEHRIRSTSGVRAGGRYNLDQDLGRKGLVRMASENKTRNATHLWMGKQKNGGFKKSKSAKAKQSPKKVPVTDTGYTSGFNSRNIDNSYAYKRRVIAVKNPKKVEEALAKAKEIASNY